MRILLLFLFVTFYTFSSQAQTIVDSTNSAESVYMFAQVMPQFPGGEAAFQKFIANNLKYPVDARAKGIQGKVYVSFIIEKDGSVSNVQIVEGRGLYPSCDAEVIRVISSSPKWTPGYQNSIAHRIKKVQVINFKLE